MWLNILVKLEIFIYLLLYFRQRIIIKFLLDLDFLCRYNCIKFIEFECWDEMFVLLYIENMEYLKIIRMIIFVILNLELMVEY